jgi:hypothetical protein
MLLLELQAFLKNAFLQFDYETAVSALQATITVSVVYIFTVSSSALNNLHIRRISEYLFFEGLLSQNDELTSFFPGSVIAQQFWSARGRIVSSLLCMALLASVEHGVNHKNQLISSKQRMIFSVF